MELRSHLPTVIRGVLLAALTLLAAPGTPARPAADPPPPAAPAGAPPPVVTPDPVHAPVPAPPAASGTLPGPGAVPPPASAPSVPPATHSAPASKPAPAPGPGAAIASGTVRTTAGATLTGAISLLPEGVEVRRSGLEPVLVPVSEWVELSVPDRTASVGGTNVVGGTERRDAGGVETPRPPAVEGGASAFPGWKASALGTAPEGRFEPTAEVWTVAGGGAGLRANSDSTVFVERRLEVAGQVSVVLGEFDGRHPEAMAGLMLRDNLGDSAAYAFLGQRAGQGICLQYRQIAGGMTMRQTNLAMPLPVWLRLERLGGSVSGEVSADGRQWMPIGRVNVNLGQNIRAGVVVASGADDTRATARFGLPALGAAGVGYSPVAGYPRVVLRGGSVLVAPVDSADESVVRLGGSLRGALVSVLNLARIEFLPLPPDLAARLEPDRRGLLLNDGDFIDGTLRGVATNGVTVNSLLFGFRRFAAGSEAALVQMGPTEPEDAAFRVVLRNGSELRARQLTLGTNEIRAESPLLGSLLVRGEDLRSVRRAGRER